jgi:hypothetical protein
MLPLSLPVELCLHIRMMTIRDLLTQTTMTNPMQDPTLVKRAVTLVGDVDAEVALQEVETGVDPDMVMAMVTDLEILVRRIQTISPAVNGISTTCQSPGMSLRPRRITEWTSTR